MTAQLRRAPILPSDHPVTREPAQSWTWADVLGGVLLAAVLIVAAWVGIPALSVLADALRGWAGVR